METWHRFLWKNFQRRICNGKHINYPRKHKLLNAFSRYISKITFLVQMRNNIMIWLTIYTTMQYTLILSIYYYMKIFKENIHIKNCRFISNHEIFHSTRLISKICKAKSCFIWLSHNWILLQINRFIKYVPSLCIYYRRMTFVGGISKWWYWKIWNKVKKTVNWMFGLW